MRVEDVFEAAGVTAHGKRLTDRTIRARCPNCGNWATLDNMEIVESDSRTTYECRPCAKVVVFVSPAPGLIDGYRFGDYVIQALGSMEMNVE